MATPDVQRDPIEAGSKPPLLARLTGIGWFNAAMLAMGSIAAIGFLIVLAGAYLTPDASPRVVLAGTIIVILVAIAWILTGLFVIGGTIIGWITFRGKAKSEARTNTESQ